MPAQIRGRIARLLSDKRRRNEYLAALALLAVVVALGVASVLTQQGHAATKEVQVLDCPVTGVVAHTHDESCYDEDGNLVCPLPEVEAHVHDDSCYAEERVLVCGLEEGEDHTHDDSCYEVERTLVCGQDEVTETHVHGPGCFRIIEVPVDDEPQAQAPEEPAAQEPAAQEPAASEPETVAPEAESQTHPKQSFYHEFKDADDNLVLRVEVEAPEGALPKGSTMVATWVGADGLTSRQQDAVDAAIARRAEGQVLDLQAVDITFRDADGAEVEPRIPVTVTFVSPLVDTDDQALVVHIDDLTEAQKQQQEKALREGRTAEEAEPRRTAEAVEALSDQDLAQRDVAGGDDRLSFDSDRFSTYVLAVTSLHKVMQASDGATVTVTVDAPAEAGIPQGAELQVREVAQGGADWQGYEQAALGALGADEAELARFFDITIVDPDGNEIQPAEPVQVEIELADAPKDAEASVVHFGEKPEVVPATEDAGVATFDASGFSVYGVVYTVDFHWTVDGKEFEWNLQGGAAVGLRELVQALDVVKDADEADAFVKHTKSAVFSDSQLINVSKVEEDTTVGKLKEKLHLEPEYSAEVTEQDIAEMDAKLLAAPDWALVSLKPFTSEEALTITMTNGEVVVIKVTDAMDSTKPYSKGTEFTAYDTRLDGFTINLFDYGPESSLDDGDTNLKVNGSGMTAGINSGHVLKFTAYGKKPSEVPTWVNGGRQNVLTLNHFSGTDSATQGIVDNNLSGGYPKLNGGGESLAYLFNTTPDGDNKKVYKDVSGLFQKDANGKYYYNSNKNYAYYNPAQGDGGSFVLSDTFPEEGSDWGVGFFPFNPWNGDKQCIHWNGWCPGTNSGNSDRYYYNHHFGMTLEGSFQLTPDCKLNGEDLVFNFSGDDDLWVFIDDVLVLDIGGIHNPVAGSINFRTGVVSVDTAYDVNSIINDSERGPAANTTITERFAAAGKEWNNEPYAEHTIKVFYMERGGCYSNCEMEFNLTRFKDVEFDKKDQYGNPIENAEFRLFNEDGTPLLETYLDHEDNDTIKYRDYVRCSDEAGHIKFDHVPVGTYYIRETSVPEGYIKDEGVYTAKVVVTRNDDGTYTVQSYVLRNGTPREDVLNIKQEDIPLSLDKKWKLGETEVNPTSASASFQLMRVKIVEEEQTVPGTKIPAVVKLQDKNGQSLCTELPINVGDTIKISGYSLKIGWPNYEATDDVKLGSETIGTLKTSSSWGQTLSQDVTYTVSEDDVTNGEVILKLNSKIKSDFSTVPTLSIESKGPDPEPVTTYVETPVTEAIETFVLPDDGSWSKSFTKPVYDEHGRKYTYYFIETSNSEETAPIYVDGNGQVISNPADLATSVESTQTIFNNIEYGSIEITKNLLKNGSESSLTGTFYYAIYAAADVENGAPKAGAQAVETGSISVDEGDNGKNTVTVRVPIGTYYVYELTGEGGQPILETSYQGIGERTYQVTGSGTSTEVGLTDGSAEFTNNYETVDKTATKTWSDNNPDGHTIYFKLFYELNNGLDEDGHPNIEDIEVPGAEVKKLASVTTSVTWDDLPKRDANGNEIIYLVKEYVMDGDNLVAAAPEGYVKAEDGLSVTNTKSETYDPRTTYSGTKIWVDTANNGATRPTSLHVTLKANGVDTDYVAQWTKGTGDKANEWTYTFSDLPVFDASGNYIQYSVTEATIPGYDSDDPVATPTQYQELQSGDPERVTTNSSLDITLDSETDLAYIAIKKNANKHLIWTQRVATAAERQKLMNTVNGVEGFIGEMNSSTTEFVSGLPIEHVFEKGTVTVTKVSATEMHVTFIRENQWAMLCYGNFKYDYAPGTTSFTNRLHTITADATKAWLSASGAALVPDSGTTATFDLFIGDVAQNRPVVLNGKTDVAELSDDPEIAKTQEVNTDAITANAYEAEPWKAFWGDLAEYDQAGNKITYTVKEIDCSEGFANLDEDGVAPGETITNKQTEIEIGVLKVDKDTSDPLTGAKFKLEKYDDQWEELLKTWDEQEVSDEEGKEGTLTFTGVSAGKYLLVETLSPSGYVMLGESPRFEVTVDEDGNLQVEFDDADMVAYDEATGVFTVQNEPGEPLPSAGGPGTGIFVTVGTSLMIGALLMLVRRRRMA